MHMKHDGKHFTRLSKEIDVTLSKQSVLNSSSLSFCYLILPVCRHLHARNIIDAEQVDSLHHRLKNPHENEKSIL